MNNKIICLSILFVAILAAILTLIFPYIQFNNATIIILTAVLIIVTLSYASATKQIAESNKRNNEIISKGVRHRALLEIQKDFRSAEMMSALAALWKFYHECNNKNIDLKKEYEKRFTEEEDKILNNKMNAKDSLNYKRRLITHFYFHLASIYKHRILPKEMIFDWWIPSDLQIFDKFIIPLQEATAKIHRVPKEETKFALKPLRELKKACESYFEENKRDC